MATNDRRIHTHHWCYDNEAKSYFCEICNERKPVTGWVAPGPFTNPMGGVIGPPMVSDAAWEQYKKDQAKRDEQKDPFGIPQHQKGAKLDKGKPDMSLLTEQFPRALVAFAEIATYGQDKYTRGGWLEVPDGFRRYTSAMLRHVTAEGIEDRDAESELLHAAHAAWNAMARLELLLRGREPKNETKP